MLDYNVYLIFHLVYSLYIAVSVGISGFKWENEKETRFQLS